MSRRVPWLEGLALSVLAVAGCKRSAPPLQPIEGTEEEVLAPLPPPPPPRCREALAGASFTLGEPGRPPEEDAGSPIALPFALEVGSAVPTGQGFALGALREQRGATTALVALVGAQGASGKLVELGRVHGDVSAPRVAGRGEQLVAVVSDNDASGGTLRLASLGASGAVRWGAERSQRRQESPSFDVELGARRGLLVWNELDATLKRGVVRLSSFDPEDVSKASAPRVVSPKQDDASAPRLQRRPGGFWLTWVSELVPTPKRGAEGRVGASPPARSASRPPEALEVLPELPSEHDSEQPLLSVGPRALKVALLDEGGAVTTPPIALTAATAHVAVYDLATLADGSLLLAWREDSTGEANEGEAVELARVRLDGTLSAGRLEATGSGAGVATVLPVTSPSPGGPLAWLALASAADLTKLVALDERLAPLDVLAPEPSLGAAEPIAVGAGGWLVSRPKGLAVELGVLVCEPGRATGPDASAGE